MDFIPHTYIEFGLWTSLLIINLNLPLRGFYLYKNEDWLCSDIAGMLLKSTGEFLDAGLQKSDNEFWESADDSTASDEIR